MRRELRGWSVPGFGLVLALVVAAAAAACGSSGSGANGSSNGGNGGSAADAGNSGGSGGGSAAAGGNAGTGGSSGTTSNYPCKGCQPFPGPTAPTCPASSLGNPKVAYPPDGVLLPPNMNVLEVQFVPPQGATLFEVDFDNSITHVKVETKCNAITPVRGGASTGCGVTLPQGAWNDIANTNRDGDPVKVTVRATANGQCVTTSADKISINFAKEDLTGGIYYWQSATYGGVAGTTGGIYYHDFGTFDPKPTPFWTSGATGTCIGCHTLSKDGARMTLMFDDPDADDEFGDVHTTTLDVANRTVLGGKNVSPGFQTFTHDHKYMIASTFKTGGKPKPGATNIDTSFDVWTGDGATLVQTDALPNGMQGTQPNLSEDDKTLVFVAPGQVSGVSSISKAGDHHFMGGSLWSATFDEATSALTGFKAFLTATGQENFYYPDQSVDGNWVVFNENNDTSAANNNGDCFYSRQGVIKIIHFPPQAGDKPLDLPNLNKAAGLSNSWPRWSPALQTYKNHKILWVTFSSNRDYGLRLKNTGFDNYYPPESPTYDQPQPGTKKGVTFDQYAAPQIWMAAVIVDPSRSIDSTDRSFPAFWLPFQDVTAHNHSAQWVAKVAHGGTPDAGTPDAGTPDGGTPDGGTQCGGQGAACGSGNPLCCSDEICCGGTCQPSCIQ